jgi:hypothetical protein
MLSRAKARAAGMERLLHLANSIPIDGTSFGTRAGLRRRNKQQQPS